ncbi:bifunctional [glutamate--ammonia ligase]-adenylyl-L-tyrosine phosphorylase/[glutamate--ammonia-ligase] adenylyltransferase [Motiliproteus sp. SC1-56]|uniref:bifunctional [glutamate--ammonia ligase]-adenylyl-L-tyrosine phosphorylase/[glutamate--ammonia-ligase] adenylyltransferase n=1 Tax=Motiliproteus sp. SC1-56 TaxID=2799565 RepID=UPI001A8E91DA|nr:bifunctional [glutamate--ammonia ligase]-adenylyl-L-tyrosine phosphorylase/[glutamate--ammonia-ligase] adenylyltransferase [Motiliproteus sp. SC1-56]
MAGPLLDQLPAPLRPPVEAHWRAFAEAAGSERLQRLAQLPTLFWEQLTRVWAGSDYVAEQCSRRPDMLEALAPRLQSARTEAQGYAQALASQLADAEDDAQLQRQLRLFRHQEMVRIIWRDLTRLAEMEETTADLSDLADACIDQALTWLYERACAQWGTPYSRPRGNSPAKPQQLVVVGMGKLGARELNLSSDIDLIFSFPSMGETQGGRRCLDNQSFFNKLGQKLIQALDAQTAEGFVFRVDMRLRPYGESGILAPCFAAMEEYYQDQGRDWERYAMIKARVVAGDQSAGAELMSALRPFVYRRYLDYSAFDSLREMKAMINREIRRRNLHGNVKLGPGGIREVEFIAQAFQLIRGGRDNRLQQRELKQILALLPDAVGMPQGAADELYAAYRFLRDSEHAVQAVADQQTQELPRSEPARLRLAYSMGFDDWEAFLTCLDHHRSRVRAQFAEVIAPADAEQAKPREEEEWALLWTAKLEPNEAEEQLARAGHEDPEEAWRLINNLRNSRRVKMMQPIGRDRLDRLMPLLLNATAQVEAPTRTLARVLQLIEAVLRRSAYLVLLWENPGALAQLVKLCSASPWFAEQLAHQPILLDELIDVRTLYSPPDKAALEHELRQKLLRIPEEDTEQLMEALRYFKNAHVLRVAAAEISGALPLMKVSDYLTYIAEVVLNGALDIAWKLLTDKHGLPQKALGVPCDRDFIIVGYGKLGGIELSYGSDLDLVFIHDGGPGLATDGRKPVDNQVFFTRLGQRIIHLLNTRTPSGQLYEVDMRLRPSGNSGLLVSSLKAFEDYQFNEAWTWEHQALVRARVVAGGGALQDRFEAVRHNVLGQRRDPAELKQAVLEMRLKMREHLGTKGKSEGEDADFHLKQDAGGIVDIEFLVQYLTLAHAADHPGLLTYTDNIRILDAIEAAHLLCAKDAEQLREAYKAYRGLAHRLALQGDSSSVISQKAVKKLRQAVATTWRAVLES